ncbi:putative quinol monooxygenase [Kribbella sp. CA-294648]|uniref:putative quinol monooxygenase n=1 Tax=Kribbella sp. CA-294648 TaxID=3239948 RepID=UPI003D8FCD3E
MTLVSRVEFTAHDGKREAFVVAAKALAAATETEPGTLRYDWYQDADPDRFVVLEEYVDAAAAFAHNQHCEQLLANAFALADMTALQLHGDITPDLQAFVDTLPVAKTYHPLT